MRKLTPAQAKAVWEALSGPVDEAMMGNMHLNDVWAEMELKLVAITAKPGEEGFCDYACEWWDMPNRVEGSCTTDTVLPRCWHPNFDGETCPTGR